MGLVLNIRATPPPPPTPDRKRRKRQPTPPSVKDLEAATAAQPVNVPQPISSALASASAPVPTPAHTFAPDPSPKKRARYTAPGSTSIINEVHAASKQDPSKAAPLPKTLPLTARRVATSSSVFSVDSFSELPLGPYLLRQLERMGLKKLTPVQKHSLPTLMSGRDMLIRSPTGSGKTLAYAVPVIQALLQLGETRVTRAAGTFALVLVPTRELCLQTYEVIERLAQPFPWLVCSTIMGGERRKAEKGRLRKGVAILIGTPGRVCDHIRSTRAWVLSACNWVVLDEADRLLDLGFLKDIASILEELDARALDGARRQTVLLSATLSSGIRELAGKSLSNFATLQLSASGIDRWSAIETAADPSAPQVEPAEPTGAAGSLEAGQIEQMEAPSQLQQSYVVLPSKQRLTGLVAFLRSRCASTQECKVLVFFSSCDGVDFHFSLLGCAKWPDLKDAEVAAGHAPPEMGSTAATGWRTEDDGRPESDGDGEGGDLEDSGAARAAGQHGLKSSSEVVGTTILRLHGKLTQQQRTQIFNQFRQLKTGVLLCTDVAARGLNLQGVHWIVQYDLPQDPKEYVHRVGRAARLGQLGRAILFLNPSEEAFLRLLRDVGMALNELKSASFQAALCPGGKRREIYVMELALQRGLEAAVLEQPFLHAAAAAAYQAYMRSYATHSTAVQRVLHIGQLHLGHLAKSFALKEIPSRIGRQQLKRSAGKRSGPVPERKRKGLPLAERMKRQAGRTQVARPVGISEFAAG